MRWRREGEEGEEDAKVALMAKDDEIHKKAEEVRYHEGRTVVRHRESC